MTYYTWNRLSRLARRVIRSNRVKQAWDAGARRRYGSGLALRGWLWRHPESSGRSL